MGLPFESDTAITRHLAGIPAGPRREPASRCGRRTCCSTAACSRPTCFGSGCWTCWANGSAAKSPPRLLEGEHDLDHAVARGAAYYGWTKQRGGMRIRGGAARAYYVGIETAGLAVPGAPRPLRALCVVPIGMEEGTEADVPSDEIGLVVGEPAHFRFFSSSVRKGDRPGDVLEPLDAPTSYPRPIRWKPCCRPTSRWTSPTCRSVSTPGLRSWACWNYGASAPASDKRWKLEFSVREEGILY